MLRHSAPELFQTPPRLPPATHPNPTALHPGVWLLFFQPLSTDLMKDVISASPRSSQMITGANSFPSRDAATRGLPNASLPRLWPMSAAEFPGGHSEQILCGLQAPGCQTQPAEPPSPAHPHQGVFSPVRAAAPFLLPPSRVGSPSELPERGRLWFGG